MARLPVDRTLIAPRQVRSVGDHVSPSRQVDSDQPGTWLEIVLDLSTTVRQNPLTRLRLAVQVSPTGSVFTDDAVIVFNGHPIGTSASGAPEDLPGMQVALARYRTRHIRGVLTVANQPTEVGMFLRAVL